MNRKNLKFQKIREANEMLEKRHFLKEQATPPPAVPATPPATATTPPAATNEPKKLTPEQEKSLKKTKNNVVSCSSDTDKTSPKEGPFEFENSQYFLRKGDPTKKTLDFWCKK
jgi:hypothetical protein